MSEACSPVCELETLRNRRDEAVCALFERYGHRLRRMIALRMDARILGKIDEEDILQDAFLEASRRIEKYLRRPAVPAFVWLRQLAIQVLIDAHRRYLGAQMRDVKQEVGLFWQRCAEASSTFLVAQLVGNLTTPSCRVVREEALAAVGQALEKLDPMDREVLVLRHLEELTNSEVAEILGVDKFAASKRYLRALGRLRRAVPAAILDG